MWSAATLRDSSPSKMYKARETKRIQCHHLISSWKFSSVLVAVFISISIFKCVGGEESLSALNSSSFLQLPPSPEEDVQNADLQRNLNVSPRRSLCTKSVPVNGKEITTCSFYTMIPIDIEDANKVKILDMKENNTIQTLKRDNLANSNLASLSSLILQNCQIHTIERGAFNGMQGLTDLDLSKNKIEVLNPEVFTGMVRLQRLNLQNNPINRFEVDSVFPPLAALNSLDMSFCEIDSMPTNVLQNLTGLQRLNLYHNRLERLDWQVFRNTKNLHTLSLGENPWHCDCHVKFLLEFFEVQNRIQTSTLKAICQTVNDQSLINMSWEKISKEQLICPPKIENFIYIAHARPSHQDNEDSHSDPNKSKLELGSDVYFECEYTGYPIPGIRWLKNDKLIVEQLSKIELQNDNFKRRMTGDEGKYNYRSKNGFALRKITAEDSGDYSCVIDTSAGYSDKKTIYLNVSAPYDVALGGIGSGGKKLPIWMWILIALLSVLILISISLLTCLIWKRREKRKQEGFRKVVHEKFKDSNVDLGDFDIKTASPHSQQSKDTNRVDGATPLLDSRSESSTLPLSDSHLRQQSVPPLPDVALGNASLVRNSQIFSPKPPPSFHGYPVDTRKEFFARQISEPYLRPGSAMSLSRPNALNASQRRYIFANQPYQSEPIPGEQENQYAIPSQMRDFPRSGSAMSVSALPEYDLRRLMFLKQYSQPQSQYGTTSRLPPRRLPSTSSEPPPEIIPASYNYSTLPRRPIRLQNWSRPVSPTNSTCSTYSTLSWRPNIDPRTGVMSDGMGARNSAHGGSTTSVNKIPDMNGSVIEEGGGIESMNRAMLTPSSGGGGKIKNARNPRYGHTRTPNSLTRGHNDFFSFEPIQEVESSECASTNHLDKAGVRQTPPGYSTQSLARGEPRYKRKKPPSISMMPNNLKTPSRAFDHLKGRSVSPALRNGIDNGEQPTEEMNTTANENDRNTNKTTVNLTNKDSGNTSIPVPVLESPIDEEAQHPINSSTKAPPPPPPPKPKRHNQSEEDIYIQKNNIHDEPTTDKETNQPPAPATADGTVV